MRHSATKSSIQVLLGSFSGKFANMVALYLASAVLGPEGFGQLLVVGIILAIFNTIIDIGFEHYYIIKVQLDGPNRTDQKTIELVENIVFNLRLYSNIFLFVCQIIVSYVGEGRWFHSPVDIYLRILALNYLVNIFGRINEVRLKKRMSFKGITQSRILGDIVAAAAKVALVYSGFGIIGWAIGVVIGTVISTIVLVINGNYKPVILKIPAAWRKEVFWFAKHSWLTGLGVYLYSQISNIIVKFFFPISQVGYLQFGNSFTLDIQSGLLSSQLNVLLPYFSNNQHDSTRIRSALNQFIEASYFIFGLPAICAVVFAEDIIALFFGPKWINAYPVFIVYSAFVVLRIIFTPSLSVLTSLGKMKEGTILAYMYVLLYAVSLTVVSYFTHNIFWFAFTYATVSLVCEATKATWGLKFLSITIWDLLSDCKSNVMVLGATLAVALCVHYFFETNSIIRLIGAGVLVGVVFLSLQFFLNRKVFSMFLDKLKVVLNRK